MTEGRDMVDEIRHPKSDCQQASAPIDFNCQRCPTLGAAQLRLQFRPDCPLAFLHLRGEYAQIANRQAEKMVSSAQGRNAANHSA